MSDPRLEAALSRYGVSRPTLLAQTGIARVYTVDGPEGPLVLKLYGRSDAGNEASGAALMRAWSGTGPMIKVLDWDTSSVLLPLLSGPTLGDLTRQGEDGRACALLAQTAARLQATAPQMGALPPLADWFDALFALRFATDCTAPLREAVSEAQGIARHLLASAPDPVALHGDLHHDNVILTQSGPVAFDAKGVLGDPAYELANAMRNPKGAEDLIRDPHRMASCLSLYAQALAVPLPRLADWTAAKSALSIAWRAGAELSDDKEADLLIQFLRLARQTRASLNA